MGGGGESAGKVEGPAQATSVCLGFHGRPSYLSRSYTITLCSSVTPVTAPFGILEPTGPEHRVEMLMTGALLQVLP